MRFARAYPAETVFAIVLATLQAIPWEDYVADDYDGQMPTVRSYRGVPAEQDERPVGVLSIDGIEPAAGDMQEGFGVPDELRKHLVLSLKFDDNLETTASELDTSGLNSLMGLCAIAMRYLKAAVMDPTTDLGDVSQAVIDDGIGPDDDNTSDVARMVQSLRVEYREDANDPTVLLRQGGNA